MSTRKAIFAFLLVCAMVFGAQPAAAAKEYQRIISMIPSVTEIVYAIGAQERLVGVTRYCIFPPEAQQKTVVGGLLDANQEVILGLSPDLIMLQIDETDQMKKYEQMGLETLGIETRSVEAVLHSIQKIGEITGRLPQAQKLAADISRKFDLVRDKVKGLPRPRVLMTFLRPVGEGTIREVYIAGNHTFFDGLINIAGGVNAYEGTSLITSPIVSPEGILRMNPDIIIEIMSSDLESKFPEDVLLKDWDVLAQLDAYKNKKIFILKQPHLGIPGPRIGDTIITIAKLIHPEVDWE